MKFVLKNENCNIQFEFNKFFDDSQDFEFNVNAKSGCFIVQNKIVWVHKNDLFNFYKKLQDCYDKLQGEVESKFEYDEEIKLKLSFNKLGQVKVECAFFDYSEFSGKCYMEFVTDQTFIAESLKELKEILK